MATNSVNVRLPRELARYVAKQTGENGLFENASEYVRDLIRRDLQKDQNGWAWLKRELQAGALADDSEFVSVSAEDVIRRNRQRADA